MAVSTPRSAATSDLIEALTLGTPGLLDDPEATVEELRTAGLMADAAAANALQVLGLLKDGGCETVFAVAQDEDTLGDVLLSEAAATSASIQERDQRFAQKFGKPSLRLPHEMVLELIHDSADPWIMTADSQTAGGWLWSPWAAPIRQAPQPADSRSHYEQHLVALGRPQLLDPDSLDDYIDDQIDEFADLADNAYRPACDALAAYAAGPPSLEAVAEACLQGFEYARWEACGAAYRAGGTCEELGWTAAQGLAEIEALELTVSIFLDIGAEEGLGVQAGRAAVEIVHLEMARRRLGDVGALAALARLDTSTWQPAPVVAAG